MLMPTLFTQTEPCHYWDFYRKLQMYLIWIHIIVPATVNPCNICIILAHWHGTAIGKVLAQFWLFLETDLLHDDHHTGLKYK